MDPLDYVRQVWIYLADHPTLVIPVFAVVGLLAFLAHRAVTR